MASSPEENLKTVLAAIQAEYEEQAVPANDRCPTLKLTQIKQARCASLPKLKGTGQQCKGIARVMGEVFRKLCDLDDDRHRSYFGSNRMCARHK